MANTYTQIYIHYVFAVKHRKKLIDPSWKNELYKYIGGVINNKKCKPIAVGGTSDHIHILVGMIPSISLSDFVRDVKRSSSLWINNHFSLCHTFEWQNGFGAFSYNQSHIQKVIKYIENQEEHHKTETFRNEYITLLDSFSIPYDDRYLP